MAKDLSQDLSWGDPDKEIRRVDETTLVGCNQKERNLRTDLLGTGSKAVCCAPNLTTSKASFWF